MEEVRLICPFTCVVAGCTMSGKSSWIKRLIESRFFDTDIPDIVYCYGEWSKDYEKLKPYCRLVQGVIDPDELDPSVHHLVILDDLMDAIDDRVVSIFVRGAHHRLISTCLVTQNLELPNFSQTPKIS